jgi:hypothetical protein
MNVSIDDFVDNVRPDVPGCPDPAIENAVRDTIVEFCHKTWILQREFVYNSTVIDAYDELSNAPYLEFDGVRPIVPDVAMRPVVVLDVFVTKAEDEDYVPLTLMDKRHTARRPYAYWESQTTTGLPTNYFAVATDAIRVYPVPSIDYYLTLRVAFKPKPLATEFDENLYDDWLEEISSGTKCRLFEMPKKGWTDYNVAAYEKIKFKTGIGRARIMVNNAFANPGLSAITRSFTFSR